MVLFISAAGHAMSRILPFLLCCYVPAGSELVLDSHIELPLFLQLSAKAPFHVPVEIRPVAGPQAAAQAQGAPGFLVIHLFVQCLPVRCRKMQGPVTAEFMEQAGL